MKYEEAMQRLEEISQLMESNELGIDQLADKLREARELIKFCNDKLVAVDADIKKVIEDEN